MLNTEALVLIDDLGNKKIGLARCVLVRGSGDRRTNSLVRRIYPPSLVAEIRVYDGS